MDSHETQSDYLDPFSELFPSIFFEPSDEFDAAPVMGDSSPAAVPVQARRRPRHSGVKGAVVEDTRDVVGPGEIKEETAELVWAECRKDWKLGTSSEQERELFLDKLTLALIKSTSKGEENLRTEFKFNGKWYKLRTIYDVMKNFESDQDSMLRIFARSYKGGILAWKMFQTLRDPANVEARQEMAMRSNGPAEHACYMIDVLDAVARHSGYTFTEYEIGLHTLYKARRTEKARASAQSVGMLTAGPDTSTKTNQNTASQAEKTPMAPPAPAATRLSFADVR